MLSFKQSFGNFYLSICMFVNFVLIMSSNAQWAQKEAINLCSYLHNHTYNGNFDEKYFIFDNLWYACVCFYIDQLNKFSVTHPCNIDPDCSRLNMKINRQDCIYCIYFRKTEMNRWHHRKIQKNYKHVGVIFIKSFVPR